MKIQGDAIFLDEAMLKCNITFIAIMAHHTQNFTAAHQHEEQQQNLLRDTSSAESTFFCDTK